MLSDKIKKKIYFFYLGDSKGESEKNCRTTILKGNTLLVLLQK